MDLRKVIKRNAGFTMVELMITAAVLSSGMVLISGSMVTFSNQNMLSEQEAMSTGVGRSVFENIRGLPIDEILTYASPVDNPENNTIFISGVGEAYVDVWAVIPGEEGQTEQWFRLGPNSTLQAEGLPNPIELQVEVIAASEYHSEESESGTPLLEMSTLISY